MNTNIKELLQKVKGMFDAPLITPAAPSQPISVLPFKLKDGTEISIALKDPAANQEPSVGDLVTINGMPAPEGIHELEDGSSITVDAMGSITELKEVEPITPQVDLGAMPTTPTVEERLSAIEAELSKMKMATQPVQPVQADTSIPLAMAKQDEVIKSMFELLEKMAEAPTADPITLVGNKKDQFDRQNKREAALNQIAKGIAEIRNKNKQ
jgi:hypothetical protein